MLMTNLHAVPSARRCVSDKVLENIGSVDKLEGFGDLKPEDQERVKKAFEEGSVEEYEEADEKVRGRELEQQMLQCLVWSGEGGGGGAN